MCRWILCLTMLWCSVMICPAAEEKLSLYMLNKNALIRVTKMYLAFEARHGVGPGADADLKLPDNAKFKPKVEGDYGKWVYPIALGLEIKIGTPQRRIVVMAPKSISGKYLIATDDLIVKAYTKKEIQKILTALEQRREKLRGDD